MATLRRLGTVRGVAYLKELALRNIADLLRILEWNESRGIRLFRITSVMFPHMGNHLLPARFTDAYFRGDIAFARVALERVGAYARRHGHRLTFHMNPYVQFGSPNADIVRRSVFDVVMYHRTYNLMQTPVRDRCVVLHGGGVYQQPGVTRTIAKRVTLERWITTWRTLSRAIQREIVLENDERHYGVSDLLPVCERHGIPFCFDVFHNSISAERVEVTPALLRRVMATWRHDRTPKFHLSDQERGGVFGAHAAMVRAIPAYFIEMSRRGMQFDIMIEAKNKERALLSLLKKLKSY